MVSSHQLWLESFLCLLPSNDLSLLLLLSFPEGRRKHRATYREPTEWEMWSRHQEGVAETSKAPLHSQDPAETLLMQGCNSWSRRSTKSSPKITWLIPASEKEEAMVHHGGVLQTVRAATEARHKSEHAMCPLNVTFRNRHHRSSRRGSVVNESD